MSLASIDVSQRESCQSVPSAFLVQDVSFLTQVLTRFIRAELEKYHFTKVVIALSGGLDSSLIAYLCATVLDPSQIHLVYMPYGSGLSSDEHAQMVANQLGIELEIWNIKEIADSYFGERSIRDSLRMGNVFARLRMINLFDVSAREKALVVGTSNKTELLIGYSTWYGDSAAGILPIGDVYKTQAFALAKFLHVPAEIISKPPSAELWKEQTDEGEIGITYPLLDSILYFHIDRRYTREELIGEGFEEQIVDHVLGLCRRALYKQRLPIIPKVSQRTIGLDYLLLKETTNYKEMITNP